MDKRSVRTSEQYPLRIDAVVLETTGGRIGMTICPGKQQRDAWSGEWARDLSLDIALIRQWGASAIVNLIEDHEMTALGVADTAEYVPSEIHYLRLPIPDMGVPDSNWERQWQTHGPTLRERLTSGGAILLHCKGGLGRTGLVAARLLVELGWPAEAAIAAVRRARPGTIETGVQEAYVRGLERQA